MNSEYKTLKIGFQYSTFYVTIVQPIRVLGITQCRRLVNGDIVRAFIEKGQSLHFMRIYRIVDLRLEVVKIVDIREASFREFVPHCQPPRWAKRMGEEGSEGGRADIAEVVQSITYGKACESLNKNPYI